MKVCAYILVPVGVFLLSLFYCLVSESRARPCSLSSQNIHYFSNSIGLEVCVRVDSYGCRAWKIVHKRCSIKYNNILMTTSSRNYLVMFYVRTTNKSCQKKLHICSLGDVTCAAWYQWVIQIYCKMKNLNRDTTAYTLKYVLNSSHAK